MLRRSSAAVPRRGRVREALLVACAGVAAYGLASGRVFVGLTGVQRPTQQTTQSNPGVQTRLAASGKDSEFRLWLPDDRLVETVQDLGGRVTKADVLARGVPAAGLERELLQLARASGASLQVSGQGELLFEFPKNLPRALRSRSTIARLRGVWRKAVPWFGRGGRVLFGAYFVAVVALVFCAFVVVLTASSSGREEGDGNRGPVISPAGWFGPDITFWLLPRPSYYSYCGGDMLYSNFYGPPPKMSFLESVFSVVFGDGDPNAQLRNEGRWQLMGECIAENGGAVVAEQLAPYLDPPKGLFVRGEAERERQLNDAILPVLLRFKGKAEVSPEGHIIYVFPELQESRAAGELILSEVSTDELQKRLVGLGQAGWRRSREEAVEEYRCATAKLREQGAAPADFLPEKKVKFSEADGEQIAISISLASFAILALLYLGYKLGSGNLMPALGRYYPVVALVSNLYPWLLGYTAAFIAIPGVRWFRLRRQNRRIQERNEWRSAQAAKLRQPTGSLRNKLLSAAKWALGRRTFGDTVYDSSKSASSRERKSDAEDLEAFDKLLQGKG